MGMVHVGEGEQELYQMSAPTQAITAFLRTHYRRCRETGAEPLVHKLMLSGTIADDALAPAMFSLQGGAGPQQDMSTARETNFRRGTAVWYLSSAAGAQCPFARAGIPVPATCDGHIVPVVTIKELDKQPPKEQLPRKRKRRATLATPAPSPELGPQPQRPKLLLRIPLQQRPGLSTAAAAPPPHRRHAAPDDSDDDDDNDSIYTTFPYCEPVRIPAYNPLLQDIDASIFNADEYASDAEQPPDSEDEDEDFHNSMLRPPGDDFFGIATDTGSSPESSASVCVGTPDSKDGLSTALLVKTEATAQAALWRLAGLGDAKSVAGTHAFVHGSSVTQIRNQRSWASVHARGVIDAAVEFASDENKGAVLDVPRLAWRYPSVASTASEASEDIDMFDLDPVKREELAGKLEPVDVVIPMEPDYASGNEAQPHAAPLHREAGDVGGTTPCSAAIPDELVDEVTARVQASACLLACAPVEPVALEDFDALWPDCAAQSTPDSCAPASSSSRLYARRATAPSLQASLGRSLTSDFSARAARSASFSAASSPGPQTPSSECPFYPQTPGGRPRHVHPLTRTFTPSIVATTVGGVPVYQTWLDAHRLLRRLDTGFVNVAPLMRFLRLRLDLAAAEARACVVVSGADAVEGLWAPLAVAQRLVRTQLPQPAPPVLSFNRLPQDIVSGFLRADLGDEFPPAVRQAAAAPCDEPAQAFGVAFGLGERVVSAAEALLVLEGDGDDDAMDTDDGRPARFAVDAAGKWSWPRDMAELPIVPLAACDAPAPAQLVQPRSASMADVVHPELAGAAPVPTPTPRLLPPPPLFYPPLPSLASAGPLPFAMHVPRAGGAAPAVPKRVVPRRAATHAPIVEVDDDDGDSDDMDAEDDDVGPRKRRAVASTAASSAGPSAQGRRRGRPLSAVKAAAAAAQETTPEPDANFVATRSRITRQRLARVPVVDFMDTASSSAASSSPAPESDRAYSAAPSSDDAEPEASADEPAPAPSHMLRRSSRRAGKA